MCISGFNESLGALGEDWHRDRVTIMAEVPGIGDKNGVGSSIRVIGDLHGTTLEAYSAAPGERAGRLHRSPLKAGRSFLLCEPSECLVCRIPGVRYSIVCLVEVDDGGTPSSSSGSRTACFRAFCWGNGRGLGEHT